MLRWSLFSVPPIRPMSMPHRLTLPRPAPSVSWPIDFVVDVLGLLMFLHTRWSGLWKNLTLNIAETCFLTESAERWVKYISKTFICSCRNIAYWVEGFSSVLPSFHRKPVFQVTCWWYCGVPCSPAWHKTRCTWSGAFIFILHYRQPYIFLFQSSNIWNVGLRKSGCLRLGARSGCRWSCSYSTTVKLYGGKFQWEGYKSESLHHICKSVNVVLGGRNRRFNINKFAPPWH